jgi:hypothetical protein
MCKEQFFVWKWIEMAETTYRETRAGILGRVMGGKIVRWNWVGNTYGIDSAMTHKMLIFKAGIDFGLGSSPSHYPKNQFHDRIDSHKESILWNQCPGVLKSLKILALAYTGKIFWHGK